jgi:hypothetical protein
VACSQNGNPRSTARHHEIEIETVVLRELGPNLGLFDYTKLDAKKQIKPLNRKKMNMKIRVFIKKLSNPRVRRRLKIAISVWFGGIILGLMFKVAYDIGYFNAQTLNNDKNAELPTTYPVLTMQSAQHIVSGALKEDSTNPKTIVDQIINKNRRLSTIIIEKNKVKKIAWIIDMHLFFSCELFNDAGYNLNEGIEHQYNISRDNFNRGDH